ncbi:MAG: hypothetical protein JJE09_01775 [Bacteroidia bacterium]|nr:hypothetical protein [Bacteroidia bacterium]
MKKLFYILVLVVTSFATFTSCTEENVTPRETETPPAGGASAPKGS